MINISKSGNAIKFAFTDSDHYLYGNGEIEVPVNSLSLIVDESNMVTFRKANSNDIFLSFNPANSNLSDKEGVINFYKTNMVGSTGGGSESGITSGEVQTMIDNSLEDYYTDDEVDAALSGKASASDVAALENEVAAKADTSAVTAVANDVSTLSGQVATKVNTTDFNAYSAATDARIAEDEEVTAAALNDIDAAISGKADTSAVTAVNDALTAHTSDTGIHVTQADKTSWNAKAEPYSAGTGIEISGNVISATGGGSVTVDPTLDTGSTNPVANSAITNGFNEYTLRRNFENGEVRYFYVPSPSQPYGGGGQLFSNFSINGRCPLTQTNGTNKYIDKFNLVETSAITSAMTSSSTDAQVPSAKAVYDTLGGLKLVKLTQSEYDQLATKDPDTLYIITNVVS